MRCLTILAALALAACGSQTPPVLRADDSTSGGISAPAVHPVTVHDAVTAAVRPEPRPEVR
jgi:hypothetical protein